MRKTFSCGHQGKGKFCHECARVAKIEAEKKAKKDAKVERRNSIGIDLDGIPDNVVAKVAEAITRLKGGDPYTDLKGKRFTTTGRRDIISIPIGWSYRMICEDQAGAVVPTKVMSHEEYNNWWYGLRRT